MNTCEKCGAPLPEGQTGICRSCARTQSRAAARARTTRTMAVAAAVLAVIFIALGTASILLYRSHNPQRFIASLTAALEKGDTKSLAGMVTGTDIAVSDEGLSALCRAFADEPARLALTEQLTAQTADSSASGAYPALGAARQSVFLGYSDYKLTVHSVQLLLTSQAQTPLLTLGDISRTGESTAQGVLYKNLFPGSYLCTVTASSATGQSVTGTPTAVNLFSVSAPTLFDGALPLADVTVANCVSDDAEISVGGVLVSQKPSGGVVALPQVAVGTTISLRYTAPYGAVTTASVVFADKSAAALAFGNVTTQGGVPSKADTDTLLRGYYAAYLDAINNQDAARLKNATDAWREQLAAALSSAENKASVFEFTDAACEEASLAGRKVGELPGFVCNATVSYKYTGRTDHKDHTSALKLSFEVVYVNSAWTVNRVATCSDADYAANAVTAFA